MTDYGTKTWKGSSRWKEVLNHKSTDMRARCFHDSDAYIRIKSDCNDKMACIASPQKKDKEQLLKSQALANSG